MPQNLPLGKHSKKSKENDASIYCLTTNADCLSDTPNPTSNQETDDNGFYIYKLQAHNLSMQLEGCKAQEKAYQNKIMQL